MFFLLPMVIIQWGAICVQRSRVIMSNGSKHDNLNNPSLTMKSNDNFKKFRVCFIHIHIHCKSILDYLPFVHGNGTSFFFNVI